MNYDVIVGCEVHVQLATKSKMFCACPNEFGGEPNSRVCPVCLGLPGSLPVPNRAAIEMAVKAGLALGCSIAPVTKFDRKNYMYPDLPKAYQISQYDRPVAAHGKLTVKTEAGERTVRILRAHMEEDTGKNVHALPGGASGVDYNRSGTPLLEIVSEPDLRSPAEAAAYVAAVREIVRALGVSDGNMEEGSLRCDANINLWVYENGKKFATPIVEVKNMNSFKAIRLALEYEVERQAEEWKESRLTLEKGRKRTRGWSEARGVTVLQRVKEEEADYRYFPEPDIKPITLRPEYAAAVAASLAELPEAKRERYRTALALSAQDADSLLAAPALAAYFERVLAGYGDAKKAAAWVLGEVKKYLNEKGLPDDAFPVEPQALAGLLALIDAGAVSNTQAKSVLSVMADTGKSAAAVVRERGVAQISGEADLLVFVDRAIKENPDSAASFRAGKAKAIGHLMGQVMKLSRGKANPQEVEQLLKKRLDETG